MSDKIRHFVYNKRSVGLIASPMYLELAMPRPLIPIPYKKALLFAGFLVLYQFLTYIANDMIMPGMIQVVDSFHGQETAIATSLTMYVMGGASLQLFLGPLSDAIGRRPVMIAGAVLFFCFTLVIACSQSMAQFLWARYFEGMGLCFISVIGYATLQEIFSEMDAIRLIAILSNIASTAPLLGPLAGATFISYFHWRGIFFLIASIALIACWGLWNHMPEPIGAKKTNGQVIPKTSLKFSVIWQNYKQLLLNPLFITGCLVIGLLSAPCITWIAISPIIIVTDAKLSVFDYALWQLPLFGAGIIGSLYLKKLTHFMTITQMIVRASLIVTFGLFLTYLLPVCFGARFEWLMPGLIIYGFGMGVAISPLNRYVLFSTPISKGTAYAMISMLSMALQGIAIEVGNRVYAHHQNQLFGLYCCIVGILYVIGLSSMYVLRRVSKAPVILSVS